MNNNSPHPEARARAAVCPFSVSPNPHARPLADGLAEGRETAADAREQEELALCERGMLVEMEKARRAREEERRERYYYYFGDA